MTIIIIIMCYMFANANGEIYCQCIDETPPAAIVETVENQPQATFKETQVSYERDL